MHGAHPLDVHVHELPEFLVVTHRLCKRSNTLLHAKTSREYVAWDNEVVRDSSLTCTSKWWWEGGGQMLLICDLVAAGSMLQNVPWQL